MDHFRKTQDKAVKLGVSPRFPNEERPKELRHRGDRHSSAHARVLAITAKQAECRSTYTH